MKTLFLFTEIFPFGVNSELAFLQNEINHLSAAFNRVYVVPEINFGNRTSYGDFTLELSLSDALQKKRKWEYIYYALLNKYLYKEFISKTIFFWSYSRLKRLIYFVSIVELATRWLDKTFQQTNLNVNNEVVLYSYWNEEVTLALCDFACRNSGYKVVSRAHGHDLYEDYYNYLPCYKIKLQMLNRLYLVSQQSLKYLSAKYPAFAGIMSMHYLGVNNSESKSEASTDNVIRIVSSSYMSPVKRIDLIVKGIKELTVQKQLKCLWVHFGDGSEYKNIEKLAIQLQSELFSFELRGFVANKILLDYYKSNPVDVFITLSESEGGVPVSIQEAQAHGIPVIGTSVGGIPEIVNSKVGVLLSENPTIEDIADAINYIIADKDKFLEMRKNSVLNWNENFNEDKNFRLFAEELVNL